MVMLNYYSHSKSVRVKVVPQPGALASAAARAPAVSKRLKAVRTALHANADRLGHLFAPIHETAETMVVVQENPMVTLLATETLTVEGPTKSDLQLLKDKYGMEVVREGQFGKVLLRNPNEGGEAAVEQVFKCAAAVYKRGKVDAAHPNFVRVIDHIQRKAPGAAAAAAAAAAPWWNHLNDAAKGVRGADAAVRAAWTMDRGNAAIRVAVLDEGVDVSHPDLSAAVVDQKDFVDGNPTAAPSGNDAHGTACAGIILGRGDQFPGITGCALVAVRIAKDDGSGGWVFDDFATADAIDWSWNDAKADVLSNSWGGGPPVDVISNAFERARTRGRGGKGSVIAIAAGNSNGPINYPATLPEVLCVGASNEWDERKSPTSKDGENWWGSCFGPQLSLVAPGVHIATTDIAGAAGYTSGDYILTFNGTSSATPHVAAAAALILSVAPGLKEKAVRDILTGEAAKMTGAGKLDPKRKWNKEMGWGRLDIHAALRRALHP
jgi:subtilisin family serine protease